MVTKNAIYLAVSLNQASTMAGVDFESTEGAQFDPENEKNKKVSMEQSRNERTKKQNILHGDERVLGKRKEGKGNLLSGLWKLNESRGWRPLAPIFFRFPVKVPFVVLRLFLHLCFQV